MPYGNSTPTAGLPYLQLEMGLGMKLTPLKLMMNVAGTVS